MECSGRVQGREHRGSPEVSLARRATIGGLVGPGPAVTYEDAGRHRERVCYLPVLLPSPLKKSCTAPPTPESPAPAMQPAPPEQLCASLMQESRRCCPSSPMRARRSAM